MLLIVRNINFHKLLLVDHSVLLHFESRTNCDEGTGTVPDIAHVLGAYGLDEDMTGTIDCYHF